MVEIPLVPVCSAWVHGGVSLDRASQCLWWGQGEEFFGHWGQACFLVPLVLQSSLLLTSLSPDTAGKEGTSQVRPFLWQCPLCWCCQLPAVSHGGKGVLGLVSKESAIPTHLLFVELLVHPPCQCFWLAWWWLCDCLLLAGLPCVARLGGWKIWAWLASFC